MKKNVYLAQQPETYDAIVVGSGIAGGWAAKELTEKGLKTLVLERGRNVEHVKDYITEHKAPWEFELRGNVDPKVLEEDYSQSTEAYPKHPNTIPHPTPTASSAASTSACSGPLVTTMPRLFRSVLP